ncbi:MAG: hypothetical protein IKS03_06085 [Ruminococcus sp.]|nr:hypothetical protein [Ruminococcus sp.]
MYSICAMYGSYYSDYYSSSSDSRDFSISPVWIIVSIVIMAFICGFATKTINENKGYEGGFWWGFLCGFVGLIVMACKPVSKNFYKQVGVTIWKCEVCGSLNPATDKSCCKCGKPRS